MAQEKNFDFLYHEWVISDVESNKELLVLRYPKSENLSEEDMRIIYDFKSSPDSVLSNTNVGGELLFCVTPPSGNYGKGLKEQWSLSAESGRLERIYYMYGTKEPIYKSVFEVVQLSRGCLKLKLMDEIFAE